MIPQLILTVALGIGVPTLATISVFNTAGLRIHDHVKVGDERKGSRIVPTFSHVYWGDQAQRLRITLGNLPRTAMVMAAALAVVLLAVGFAAHARVVDQSNPQGVYPYVLVILSANPPSSPAHCTAPIASAGSTRCRWIPATPTIGWYAGSVHIRRCSEAGVQIELL